MLVSLQALRALAAWLVVFHHFMQVFFDFRADSLGGRLLSTRGQVGVDIFFVLSGFVIQLSCAGRQVPGLTFLAQRLARIAPAYWLYTAITALILYAFGNLMPVYGVALPQLLLSLLFLPSQNPGGFGFYPILPVGWTLNVEMLFYLLFALSFAVGERWRPWLVGALLALVSGVLAKAPWLSNFYRNPIVCEFLFGLLLAELYRRGLLRLRASVALPLALGALLVLLHFPADHPWRPLTWGLPSAARWRSQDANRRRTPRGARRRSAAAGAARACPVNGARAAKVTGRRGGARRSRRSSACPGPSVSRRTRARRCRSGGR